MVPVEGTVTLDGKPLTTGTVIFSADADRGNTSPHEPRGPIDDRGRYKLSIQSQPGAPPGWYKVAVASFRSEGLGVPPVYLAPPVYANPRTSPLEPVEVVENPAPGAYDLKLRTPAPPANP
jgi:hypothetical protein